MPAELTYGLTEENHMIADTVRSFVEKEIYPHEAMVERNGEVPQEIADEIKRKTIELGFYACNFPESVGCAGLNHLEFALVERELGRGSMALNHFFGRPQNILMACEGEQIERYLMPAVRGERMDALAMTEPGAGSDVRGMKCNAVRDGGDWVVNGTKHFISGADHADFIIVFIAKCVGRFGCIGYMCLAIGDYEVGFSSKLLFLIWAVVALLVIALYWVLWIRQYKKGNHFEDIYGTGIPLFIIPAAFVLVTGIFSMNFMLIIFSVLDIVCEYCSAYGVRKRLHPAKTEESSDEAEKKENEDGE